MIFSSGPMFSYVSPEERVPANHPLRPIRKLTDRVLEGLSATFDAMYSSIGWRSVAPEELLRARQLRRSRRLLLYHLQKSRILGYSITYRRFTLLYP
jgi:hypothetical protein